MYKMTTTEEKIFNKMHQYIKYDKCLYKQPFQRLLNLRRDKDSYIVFQSPYFCSDGTQKWTDFSVCDKSINLDIRIEVKNLNTKGSIKNDAYEHLMGSTNIPEKLLVIVLIGCGYDDHVCIDLHRVIEMGRLNATIILGVDNFNNYIDSRYRNHRDN